MIARGGPAVSIGMPGIKTNRLGYAVKCHPGDTVGDCVPFYYCPRSVMLYVIHMANHPGLSFRGGQGSIVHFEADLHDVVNWAATEGRRWAIALANAGAFYTEFRPTLAGLEEIDWAAVQATDFRSRDVQERKAAEFLLRGSFPWPLVSRIGVPSPKIAAQVQNIIATCEYQPRVEIRSDWYF